MEYSVATPVAIEPKQVYGIKTDVIGSIHFNVNQEVIYPVEGVLAFHDYVKNKQRLLRLPANTTPTIICLNTPRLLMGVVEITTTEEQERITNIVIYDLTTMKKQRSLQLPLNAQKKRVTHLSFTCDSNAIVALTEYPDEMMYMIMFDRLASTFEGRAGNTNRRGMANFIACNPVNPLLVVVSGNGVFKMLLKSEKGMSLVSDLKPEFTATSMAWISSELLMVGLNNGVLLLFENGVKKRSYASKDIEAIDLAAEAELEDESPPVLIGGKSQAIVCMKAFPRGLAYAIFNQVYVFEKISKTNYERKTILDIPPTTYPEPLYQITNLAINTKQDTVIVTAKHNQIYVGVLIVPESLKTKRLEFSTLGELIHIDEIVCICVCSWRPVVISSSKDKTIRVWNYQTGKVELVKRFPAEVSIIELYASGQYVVAGFADKVKIMQVFMDDLNLIKDYAFPDAKDIKVSHFGHLLTVAYEKNIAVISVFNFETLKTFKGQSEFTALAWARNDKSIFSAAEGGILYQWDLETGNRLQELVDPATKYNALCVTNDPARFFAVTHAGTIREIISSNVTREIKLPGQEPVLDVAMAKSDLIMFASTDRGHLYNIHLPLSSPGGGNFTSYSFFDTAITNVVFSYDGSLLITCSSSGTLVIWSLKNVEAKLMPIDQDLLKSNEVLIPRNELEDKIGKINSLEIRLKQQAAEFYKKQTQSEENEAQQMADTHKGYCEALAEMKAKNEEIGVRHAEELTQITSQIDELNDNHRVCMDTLAAQYSERMLMEYQKFASLRENMLKIRDSYEEKLWRSKNCLRDTVEALELDFKKQLEERQDLIKQLMVEKDDKKEEFIEYCRHVEIENDRKMIDCQIDYEKKVKFERDEIHLWRDRAESQQAKFDLISKECDNLLDEVTKLRKKHFKFKAQIAELKNDIKGFHKDVADREHAISVKEKRIDEILTKNQELEKYKHVLNHKINELKAQIEPREQQIVEKRKQIAEMEQELNGLWKNHLQLGLQLKELKDKCLSANVELKTERARAKSAQVAITDMCTQIYMVASKLNHPDKLREGIKYLFHKYSADDALKKFVSLDTQIQADLNRQRKHIEKIMYGCKVKMQNKSFLGKAKKLISDNKILQDEVNNIKKQNEKIKEEIKNMGILVTIFKKTKSLPNTSLPDTVVEIEKIDKYFEDRIAALSNEVKNLIEENEKINEDLERIRKRRNKSDG